MELTGEVLGRYKNPDNDPRGPWQSVSANAQAGHATASQFYTLRLPSGRELEPPKGRCWLYTKDRMEQEIAAGNIWFGADGDNVPRVKKFLRDNEEKGLTPETIWFASDVGTNDEPKKHLLSLLPTSSVFRQSQTRRTTSSRDPHCDQSGRHCPGLLCGFWNHWRGRSEDGPTMDHGRAWRAHSYAHHPAPADGCGRAGFRRCDGVDSMARWWRLSLLPPRAIAS